ncbi:MAG: four helix bundle protein [Thermodesulfobacteriota bacterium]
MIKNYKGLKVWQKAYQLCIKTYKITKGFPKKERYGLTSQIRRAAVSVPSNRAEGYGRKITSDDLKNLQRDIGDIEKMLKALSKCLENRHLNP